GRGLFITSFVAENAKQGFAYRPESLKLFEVFYDINQEMKELNSKFVKNFGKNLVDIENAKYKIIGNDDVNEGLTTANQNILITSPSNISLLANEELVAYSNRDLNLSAKDNVDLNAGDNGLFSAFNNIQITAQNELAINSLNKDMELQAQSSNISIHAKQNVNIATQNNNINLTSPSEINLSVGNSYIKLTQDGIEIGTNGDIKLHASSHEILSAKSEGIKLPSFNDADSWIQLALRDLVNDEPIKSIDYIISMKSGTKIKGKLDEDGKSIVHQLDESGIANVDYQFPDGISEEPHKQYKNLESDLSELLRGNNFYLGDEYE
ncbi:MULTISPECIES: DUF2345 domain-containing protein, partial [unclassified Moraxella]